MAKFLIGKGASIVEVNKSGETPLDIATENEMLSIIAIVLDQGWKSKTNNEINDEVNELVQN